MTAKHFFLGLLISSCIAFPLDSRADDPKADQIIAAANIPKYVASALNRDITDWLAIGDSFSAGISADIPADELEYWCSRFKMSYPNQMNENPRFPGHSASRTFVFGACSGGKMDDVVEKQIEYGDPDLSATHPKIGKPQIGTLSISGNDLGFGDIVNACLYHWVGYKDCTAVLKDAHKALDDPGKVFEFKLLSTVARIMARARTANSSFQLYITGYIQFWNEENEQCNSISWAPFYKDAAYLTVALRKDMNSLVDKLNNILKATAETFSSREGGVFYVDGFQQKFDGHRFCEVEKDPGYHKNPVDSRTWFIHYNSPYQNPASVTGLGAGDFFDQANSALIPPKDGKTTEDQIKAVNGDLAKLNPAYNSVESMTAALTKLGQVDLKYSILPITWLRMMHPKGSGYAPMADAVIDNVLRFGAKGASSPATAPGPAPVQGRKCTGTGVNKFISRDDLNDKIGNFCADAAKKGVQDKNTASTARKYNSGSRYEVILSMDWPSGLDIRSNMEANCKHYMTSIMDDCDGNDKNNPLNWKHGGSYQVDQVKYNIIPTVDQGYTPGICSFHLQEDEQWSGVDGPGTMRTWYYEIERATMKDGAGAVIGKIGFAADGEHGAPVGAGDKSSLSFDSKLPEALVITPEAQGNPRDYVQFAIGSQSWRTTTDQGTPRCQTGNRDSDWSPANRNMDCYFNC